jgi:hypothetical protein
MMLMMMERQSSKLTPPSLSFLFFLLLLFIHLLLMLPPTLVPMKTTAIRNSSPCHSHFSYVGEVTIDIMHPPHEDNRGEKSTPPLLGY